MKTKNEILTVRAMQQLFNPGTTVADLDEVENKMLGEKIAELSEGLGCDPEVAIGRVREFVLDAYEKNVNPLPILRKVYSHLQWDYVPDVHDEEPGTEDTRIPVASEEYRVACGQCYIVASWKE
jgi:hypothetical protein